MERLGITIILIFALAARLIATLDPLWLDEIWSLNIAMNSGSLGELIKVAIAVNCHILTTLWMYIVGDAQHSWILRLPSFTFSVLSLFFAAFLGYWLEGRRGIWVYATVFGFSYFLVQYGTEARGYSEVVFHALLGFWILHRNLTRDRRWRGWNWIFGANAVLGLLAQPIFLIFLLATGTWSGFRFLYETKMKDIGFLRDSVESHALPILLVGIPWALGFPLQTTASGFETTFLVTAENFIRLGFGVPSWGVVLFIAVLTIAALMLQAFRYSVPESDRSWLRLLVLLAVMPFAVLFFTGSSYLYERFFILALPFLYILAIRGALKTYDCERWSKLPVISLLVMFVLGNAALLVPFLSIGRGHYLEALEDIASKDKSKVIRVGVDQLFRNAVVIDYYSRRLEPRRAFEVVSIEEAGWKSTDWLFLHRFKDEANLPSLIKIGEMKYARIGAYRKFGPSGWNWFLYHRLN